ncbi:hypothetical protein [Streptomyces sp. TLI_105]|uniref:hypothetical protein n=1 Tax=Streptomyces sp. TLI_105 TaxID=1881019 RepID=UPI00089C5A2B|nr:hypothetical protein [Streptomyces sp. TLI_105]SED50037.1 hypothetical protein SAMN05428939_5371 [Streptomyces sp. TLI_105]
MTGTRVPDGAGGPVAESVAGGAGRATAGGRADGAPAHGRVLRLLRGVAYAALPAGFVLFVCLLAGVRISGGVLLVGEVLVLGLPAAEGVVWVRLRRRGLSRRAVAAELVPGPVLRLVGHELRLMASLGRWVARRRHGVAGADGVFPHGRDQAALMYGFAFVCLVETVGMSYLLDEWPFVHAVFLVLDVYTVLFVLGLHAASVTRPHTLTGNVLRLRQAAHVDVSVPLDRIAAVRRELCFSHEKAEGELNLAVGSQTSVTIELTGPVDAPRLLGAPRPVRLIRLHADDPKALYEALTRARTAPSPSPGPLPTA